MIQKFKGKTYKIQEGMSHLIPANCSTQYETKGNLVMTTACFNAKIFQHLDIFENYHCEYQSKVKDPKEHYSTFQQLKKWFNGPDQLERKFVVRGLMYQIAAPFLATLKQEEKDQNFKSISRFQPVLNYIDDNLGKHIQLSELASLVHIEKNYFSTLFTKAFKRSPFNYILDKKIQKAQVLLWSSDDNLDQISYYLGFSDRFHFSKTFKKITGYSPKDFRQMKYSSQASSF